MDVEKGNPGHYLTIIVYNDVIMITVKPYEERVLGARITRPTDFVKTVT